MYKNAKINIINATWGGQFYNNLSNKITFFHYDLKE